MLSVLCLADSVAWPAPKNEARYLIVNPAQRQEKTRIVDWQGKEKAPLARGFLTRVSRIERQAFACPLQFASWNGQMVRFYRS